MKTFEKSLYLLIAGGVAYYWIRSRGYKASVENSPEKTKSWRDINASDTMPHGRFSTQDWQKFGTQPAN